MEGVRFVFSTDELAIRAEENTPEAPTIIIRIEVVFHYPGEYLMYHPSNDQFYDAVLIAGGGES